VPRSEDIWGDDASERDADATIAELSARGTDSKSATDETPGGRSKLFFPLHVVGRFIKRNGRRVGVAIAGFTLILVGVALLVLPGPGWLLIFAGLAVLATEYVWAQRLLNVAKRKAEQAKNKVLRKTTNPEPPSERKSS
jgi:hypothetical protein